MRIDVVSIFPAYFDALRLSLFARARAAGLVSIDVRDLRSWTSDRHRTVDDTPYGGGAGMVMGPEPWGHALDAVLAAGSAAGVSEPTLVVPSPAGEPFTQEIAERLSRRPWLVFACGRYEGIDQRVVDHFASRVDVLELSIGDYVVNGGEVAVLAMIEAVARLLPGFVGNPQSLAEESHAGAVEGLLEYPVYTKPSSWRGLDVPPVLLSGHHEQIAAWRREQAVRRTAQRRPDLAHPSRTLTVPEVDVVAEVRLAEPADAGELLTLQRCCWLDEGRVNETFDIPPLVETLDDVRAAIAQWRTFVVRVEGRLVASVRCRPVPGPTSDWEIGRLMVAPDLAGRGLGRWLLEHAEAAAPPETASYRLVTGARSARNIRRYRRAGYRIARQAAGPSGVVTMVKPRAG